VAQARITKQVYPLKIFADASSFGRGPTLTLTNYQRKVRPRKKRISLPPLADVRGSLRLEQPVTQGLVSCLIGVWAPCESPLLV
jgi:hypothetical protein